MKTVMKNLLLGSVAGLAMVGTAAAADLPVKAKAAEYVKICSTYGAGFYYIPGTDTCLKVGGYVTADVYVQDYDYDLKVYNNGDRVFTGNYGGWGDTETYFKTRAAIQLDARTQTEYGTLRSYFEGRFEYGESYGVGELDNGQAGYFFDAPGQGSLNDVYVKYAYIQFAGFTFGKATSAFDFWAGDFWYGIDPGSFYSDTTPNLISYTADFGNGFSATISIEDAYAREGGATFGGTIFNEYAYYADAQGIPDIVANLTYEGSWGSAKIAGALHDERADDFFWDGNDGDDWGWAVLAGVKFEFAETTTLYVEGAYADGAAGYLGLASFVPNLDASGSTVAGWYIGGALQHYWTPTVFTSLVGSWTQTDDWNTYVSVYPWNEDGKVDFEAYNVGVNIGWQPVKGLTFVLQYDYLQYEYDFKDDYALSGDKVDLEYSQNRFTFSAKRSF